MAAKKAGLGKGLDSLIIPNKAKHTGDENQNAEEIRKEKEICFAKLLSLCTPLYNFKIYFSNRLATHTSINN